MAAAKRGGRSGGMVMIDDAGAARELQKFDRVVARAQDLSRKMVGSKAGASVEDFLANRAREAAGR